MKYWDAEIMDAETLKYVEMQNYFNAEMLNC